MPNKRSFPKAKPATVWRAIEAGYRAGLAVRVIAQRHGMSMSAIYKRARRDDWRRDVAPRVPAAPKPGRPAAPGPTAPKLGTPADDLARLRRLATKLRRRLERLIDGRTSDDAVLGGRESPASLLLKLCQITEKIIAMERRLAGAAAPTPRQLNEQDRDILDRFKRRHGVG